MDPDKVGARRVGAHRGCGPKSGGQEGGGSKGGGPNPEKVGAGRVGAGRVGARRVGSPKFRVFFFPLPPQNSFFSSLSGGLLVEFWVFEAPGPSNVHISSSRVVVCPGKGGRRRGVQWREEVRRKVVQGSPNQQQPQQQCQTQNKGAPKGRPFLPSKVWVGYNNTQQKTTTQQTTQQNNTTTTTTPENLAKTMKH